jgi:hypothetical protein
MYTAYDNSTGPDGERGSWEDRHGYAAEIRALADWLVPETDAPTSGGDLAKIKHLVSLRFRAQLLDESDRAETNDD